MADKDFIIKYVKRDLTEVKLYGWKNNDKIFTDLY